MFTRNAKEFICEGMNASVDRFYLPEVIYGFRLFTHERMISVMSVGEPVVILTLQEFNDLLDMVYGNRDITEELNDRVNQFMDKRKYAKAKAVSILEYYH